MILLDTTILAYAAGGEHPLRRDCARLITAVADGLVQATTTVEVIQEFAYVYASRRDRAVAARLAGRYAEGLAPLLAPGAETLRRGLALWKRTPGLGSFGAVLAAAALEHDAEALVSADTAFSAVPRLRHVAPGTPRFERLVGASA